MMVANMAGPGKGCESRCKLWGVYSLLYGDRGAFTGHGMLVMILALQHRGAAFGMEQLFVEYGGYGLSWPSIFTAHELKVCFSINFRKPDSKSLHYHGYHCKLLSTYCSQRKVKWPEGVFWWSQIEAGICSQAGNEDLGQMETGRWRKHESFYDQYWQLECQWFLSCVHLDRGFKKKGKYLRFTFYCFLWNWCALLNKTLKRTTRAFNFSWIVQLHPTQCMLAGSDFFRLNGKYVIGCPGPTW